MGRPVSALRARDVSAETNERHSPRIVQVKVKPNARDARFERMPDGTWLAAVKAPPVDGKANDELMRMIAAHFHVGRGEVSIKRGGAGRMKFVQIGA